MMPTEQRQWAHNAEPFVLRGGLESTQSAGAGAGGGQGG